MCNPVAYVAGGLLGGLVASKAMGPKVESPQTTATQVDPAAERAAAEAEAANRANIQLAADQRRRREQGSLMSRGAPTFGLGDAADGTGLSPIGPSVKPVTRNTTAQRASLMSRGAPAAGGGTTFSGGGGGGSARNLAVSMV